MSQSSESKTHDTSTQPDLPLAIKSKISPVSYDNAAWHTDFCKQDASTTSYKILQPLYLCLKVQFEHTNIYEYIQINFIYIYSICNKKGKVLCIIQYKFNVSVTSPLAYMNRTYTLLASSFSTTVQVTESTSVTNMKPAIEEDATSAK